MKTEEIRKELAKLRQRRKELQKDLEEVHKANVSEWLNRLNTIELEGEKKQVIGIYKMCVINKIKARAVFGRIENGNFVYFDPKWESEKTVAVPAEFDVSMLAGLDFEKYEKIKKRIVPKDYLYEKGIGNLAEEYGIEIKL